MRNHVVAHVDSQPLFYAVTVLLLCVLQAALAVVEFVIEWADVHVQVFANQAKVAEIEVAKAQVIFTLVHYLNQINKVISAITKAGNICQ